MEFLEGGILQLFGDIVVELNILYTAIQSDKSVCMSQGTEFSNILSGCLTAHSKTSGNRVANLQANLQLALW